MKKTIYLVMMSALIINYSKAQSGFGITAGATFASYKATIESLSLTSKTHVGFTAGIVAATRLGKNFGFRPELNFVQKGGKYTEQGYSDQTTLNYIELPLNFVYNATASKGTFFIGAGPSLSMGLSGKDKWNDGGESGTDDLKFGSNDDDDFKSFEAGLNFLAGYQFANGFFISANYNTALSNISPNDPGFDSKYHNRYFGLHLGIIFKHKASIQTSQQ